MRTLIIVVAGLMLAVLILRLTPAPQRTLAAVAFSALWFVAAAWNLRVGLSHGYTFAQELPIHVVLYGVPTAAAWALWWWMRR